MEVDWKYKLRLFVLYAIAYSIFYVYPNFNPLFPPRYLPLTPIDEWMPFLPWAFLVYLSDYILALIPILFIRSRPEFDAFARTVFSVLIVCGLFFYFFPTAYARPDYPEVSNPILGFLMSLVAVADAPTNCFPSMHVATTTVATWATRIWGRKVFALFVFWAILICWSTLATKQHYFWDILGGLSVGVVVAYLDSLIFAKDRRNSVSRAFTNS